MTAPQLARCTTPGCPVRYRHGDNRPCVNHAEDASGLELWRSRMELAPDDDDQADSNVT